MNAVDSEIELDPGIAACVRIWGPGKVLEIYSLSSRQVQDDAAEVKSSVAVQFNISSLSVSLVAGEH